MSLSLQDTTKGMACLTRKRTRRNRANDLEKEVNEVISKEENSDVELGNMHDRPDPVTPRMTKSLFVDANSQSPSVIGNATPRRSTRKSIKPLQEYEEIVSRRRQLRSKKADDEKSGLEEENQARWTPAKVGRVSQKRGRKSRRTDKNQTKTASSSDNEDAEKCYEKQDCEMDSDTQNDKIPLPEIEIIKTDQLKAPIEDEQVNSDLVIELTNEDVDDENIINNTRDNIKTTVEGNEKALKNNVNTQSKDDTFTKIEADPIQEERNKENIAVGAEVEKTIEKEGPILDQFNKENIAVVTEIGEDGDESEVEKNEDFGTYLKCNVSDISEIGLNPLNEELIESSEAQSDNKKGEQPIDVTDNPNAKRNDISDFSDLGIKPLTDYAHESEEDKSANMKVENSSGNKDILNATIKDGTFNDSDCIILNTEEKPVEDDMQSLRFSDDESGLSPPRKSPRIVLTTLEGKEELLNSSVPILQDATPKRYSKTAQRKPTPFKPKSTVYSDDEIITAEESNSDVSAVTITVSQMEPKEIVLRSIRKRSWSVCIGGAEADNKRKNVTFYSPANQTTILEDLDMRIVQSVKKNSSINASGPQPYVTQRRKRSLSFDEATMRKTKSPGQAPTKIRTTPIAKPPARTKLPNFAAIHQKNFEKMENLVDHVNRKAERAKVLTNSATKSRLLSAQKTVQTSSTATSVGEKPKVSKRINLHNISTNTTFTEKSNKTSHMATDITHKDHTDSKLPIKQFVVLKPMPSTTETVQSKENKDTIKLHLPNPRLGIIKPHTITVSSSKNKQTTPAKNIFKPMQPRKALRPAFNLSTALESHAANNANPAHNTSSTQMFVTKSKTNTAIASTAKTTTKAPRFDEKMASRRQRHMDMFKGRTASARTTPGSADKNYGHQIRGVRSNRRFELQMAHRKNLEN